MSGHFFVPNIYNLVKSMLNVKLVNLKNVDNLFLHI